MSVSLKYLKDYKVVDYQNPLLRKKMLTRRRRGLRFFLLVFLGTVVGLFYFFFLSPFFLIKNIDVQSTTVAPEIVIAKVNAITEGRFLFVISRKNIWFFNGQMLADEISKNYFLETLLLEKQYPDTIKIFLKEKTVAMRWLNENRCYNVDSFGTVIGFCEAILTTDDIFLVHDALSVATIEPGVAITDPKTAQYLIELNHGFLKTLGLTVISFNFLADDKGLKIHTNYGMDIYCNKERPVGEIISKLAILFDKEIPKSKFSLIEYIDMRFGEKIYYK